MRSLNDAKGDVFVRWDAESANLSDMGLRSVPQELAACKQLTYLVLSMNALDSLDGLPPNLYHLNISWNRLRSLEGLPEGLRVLFATNNLLEHLRGLPPRLRQLNVWSNYIQTLEGLPDALQELYARCNALRGELDCSCLPKGLQMLFIQECRIERIHNLPPDLLRLEVSSNLLEECPELPDGLQRLYAVNNLAQFCIPACAVPPYLQVLQGMASPYIKMKVNTRQHYRENMQKNARRIALDFLSCCPLVQRK